MKNPNDKLRDDVLHHTLNLFRLSAQQTTETMKRLEAMKRKLIAELSSPSLTEGNKNDVKKILRNADEIITHYYGTIENKLEAEKVARTTAKVSGKSLKIALGDDGVAMPSQTYFKSIASNVLIEGSPAKAWWNGQAKSMQFKFAGAVRQGLANNETNQQIISRIVGKGGEPGIIAIARKQAATLVQTSVQAVANDARLATFRENSDVINGVMQVSTLDSHTTDICMAYDGASWDLDGNPIGDSPAFNSGPPRHFNCRSVLVPITKTFRELGIDVDEAKSIKEKLSFEDFLKSKGTAYQDEMLGDGRADLWRDGKITLRDLVSGQGRPLTLSQLEKKFR